MFNDEPWEPRNYENEYDGPVTLRRALAHSRNVATIKVAETTGYGEVAALWRQVGAGASPRAYAAISLGVFEATPFEIATAYTLFPNGGTIRPLRAISRLVSGGQDVQIRSVATKTVARRDTTFLVTNMMRSVLNEGTAASARAAGFTPDAAGKTGTTNDLRDAWFVGFTPELVTVVWVGLDDNQPLGLSGSTAALPIWTSVHDPRARRASTARRSRRPRASCSSTSIVIPASSPAPPARGSSRSPSSSAPSRKKLCRLHGN